MWTCSHLCQQNFLGLRFLQAVLFVYSWEWETESHLSYVQFTQSIPQLRVLGDQDWRSHPLQTEASSDGAVLPGTVASGSCGTQQKRQWYLEALMMLNRRRGVGGKANRRHVETGLVWEYPWVGSNTAKGFYGDSWCVLAGSSCGSLDFPKASAYTLSCTTFRWAGRNMCYFQPDRSKLNLRGKESICKSDTAKNWGE